MPVLRVARVGDIPVGKGVFVDTGGVVLAVFNAGGGRYHATSPACPHEDGPLADGWVEDGCVVCPWHGYDFDLRTGRCRVAPELAVTAYPVRVAGDAIEVEVP